jgi:hypothetical protein
VLDQIEDLLRAGHWLGPAVLGVLCYRLLIASPVSLSSDEVPGALMLASSAIILTIAGVRTNVEKHAVIAPLVFGAMFLVSWTIR